MLALQEFGLAAEAASTTYCLAEVSVACAPEISVRQRRLGDDTCDLADRLPVNARYYLKPNSHTETLIQPENTVVITELLRESQTDFLHVCPFFMLRSYTVSFFAMRLIQLFLCSFYYTF